MAAPPAQPRPSAAMTAESKVPPPEAPDKSEALQAKAAGTSALAKGSPKRRRRAPAPDAPSSGSADGPPAATTASPISKGPETELKTCCSCKEEKEQGGMTRWSKKGSPLIYYRCKDCNRYTKRMSDVFKEIGVGSRAKFDSQCEDKMQFYNDNKNLTFAELKAQIQLVITEIETHTDTCRFRKTDEFMDETDIKDKFKHKPEQQKEILESAHAFICSTTKAKMWAIPKYTAIKEEGESRVVEKKRRLEQNDEVKAPKQQKAASKARPESKAKELSDTQKKRLQKLLLKLTEQWIRHRGVSFPQILSVGFLCA